MSMEAKVWSCSFSWVWLGMSMVLWNNKLLISNKGLLGLVKLAQRCSGINQQFGFLKKLGPLIWCAFLGFKRCSIVAINLMSAKPDSWVVDENGFGQSVSRVF